MLLGCDRASHPGGDRGKRLGGDQGSRPGRRRAFSNGEPLNWSDPNRNQSGTYLHMKRALFSCLVLVNDKKKLKINESEKMASKTRCQTF